MVGAFIICWSPMLVLSFDPPGIHSSRNRDVCSVRERGSEPILYCVFDTNFTDTFRQMVARTVSTSTRPTEDDVQELTDNASRNQRRYTLGFIT